MTVSDAAIVLEVASTLEESGEVGLTDTAKLLRGMLGEIQRLGTQLTAAQSERAESAEAKLASQVPGVVRIPELTFEEREAIWKFDGSIMDGTLAWARTHAEVVVEAVDIPEWSDDGAYCTPTHAEIARSGWERARACLRAMQQAREVVG